MYKSRIGTDINPIVNESGEKIKELFGPKQNFLKQSIAEVIIPYGCYSLKHYHPEAEETYIFLSKNRHYRVFASNIGKLIIDDKEIFIKEDDVIGINAGVIHQIFNITRDDLIFLVICSPAWETIKTIYVN